MTARPIDTAFALMAALTAGIEPTAARADELRKDEPMPEATHVTVSLTADEALVLFDLLHRWEAGSGVTGPEHAAEQVALWNLSALLEGQLSEPFEARYSELVASARARLASSE